MIQLNLLPGRNSIRPAPAGTVEVRFAVRPAGGEFVAAEYYADEDSPDGDTTLSVTLRRPLDSELLGDLSRQLEAGLNSLREDDYSSFVEIAEVICADLREYGVAGCSSNIPG